MEAALLLFSAACFFVGAVCLLVASRRQARDARPLRVVLGEVKPRGWIKDPAVTSLEDRLVEAGWRHVDHVNDPEHHDEAGRYLYWGD
jgi:hypothetical protein